MSESVHRTRNNREKIIQAAAKLIIEKGVANTSLADISVEVGISKGTLYYYYATKGDLIFDISVRHMRHITNTIVEWINRQGRGQSAAELLRMVFETVLKSETHGYIHFYLIQDALSGNHESLRKRFTEEYERWINLVEQGLKLILPRDRDLRTLAQIVLSSIDGMLLQKLLGVDPIPLHAVSDYFAHSDSEAKTVKNRPPRPQPDVN